MSGRNVRLAALTATVLTIAPSVNCVDGGQGPRPREPAVEADEGTDEDSLESETSAVEIQPVAESRGPAEELERVYDFVENLSQAHMRSGGVLIDFGTASRHKHTLGDWKTGWRGNFTIDETTFSYTAASQARVFFDTLPEEVDIGSGGVTIRARAVGSATGKGRVYLNGKQIGTAEFPTDEYAHATFDFARGLLKGQNELILRFERRRPGHDKRAAALAVDYIRVVPSGADKGPAASSYNAVRLASPAGDKGGLLLTAGESLSYNISIPIQAALRGRARAGGQSASGKLQVRVRLDEEPVQLLSQVEVGQESVGVHANLTELGGRMAAIDLIAVDGEVVLTDCGIVTEPRRRVPAPGKSAATNFVLVLIDTLRADHTKIYNRGTRVQTDYLDRLGAEAMTFERAWVQENWTKPSVATLLTGLYPETHGTKNEKHKLPRSVVMASEHFRSLEFVTAGFVANGYVSDKFGFREGWDMWRNYVREGKSNRAKFVVDDAIAWLERRPKDKPFFLYVHTIDPHVPYIPPRKYSALYDAESYSGPVQARTTAKLLENIKTGAVRLTQRDKFRLEALYDGEITYHDDELARLHDALAAEGLLDNTLLVVTSDHGEEFFDHGSVGHGHSVYEELLHVPLLVRLPTASAGDGARCAAEVGLVDVLPTACEILGVACPEGMEGRSLVPLLDGAASDHWPQASFADFLDGQRSVRAGRYKLIYRGLAKTVFDLQVDPEETRDLSEALAITHAALRDLLGRHQGRFSPTGDGAAAGAVTKNSKRRHEVKETEIDAETRKQLEALGYIGE